MGHAKDLGDASALRKALEIALPLLPAWECEEYEELLTGAESKEKAEAALSNAIEERSISMLKFAIQQAKDAQLDPAQIAKAEEILADEEPKQKAREVLIKAVKERAIDGLKAAIAEAKNAKLAPEEYAKASKVLKQ